MATARLYRLYRGGLERVPVPCATPNPNPNSNPRVSLYASAAYVLALGGGAGGAGASVTIITGDAVGRIDNAKIETLSDHLKSELGHGAVLRRMDHSQLQQQQLQVHDQQVREFFSDLGHEPFPIDYSAEPLTSGRWFWKLEEEAGNPNPNPGSRNVIVTLMCSAPPHTHTHLSAALVRPLETPELEASNMYLLLCDKLECFLWVGNRVSKEMRSTATNTARELAVRHGGESCEMVVLRAHMESNVFKYHLSAVTLESLSARSSITGPRSSFANTEHAKPLAERRNTINREQEETDRHRAASKVAGESGQKRPIRVEVERMTNEHMGTLGMISQGTGDSTRGLKMKLFEDSSASLKVWRVTEDGERNLSQVEDEWLGFFDSSKAYAIFFSCKAGAKVVLYLWIGASCASTTKAALALQASDLIRHEEVSGSAEQIFVEEGREPQFFLTLFARHGHPVTICPASTASDGHTKICREDWMLSTQASYSLIQGECSVTRECTKTYLQDVGVVTSRCYLFADSSNRTIKVALGLQAPTHVREQAQQVASTIARVRGFSSVVIAWESIYSAMPRGLKPGALRTFVDQPGANVRPRRLFTVSNTRRFVGAIFVEELGHGGTYSQADLNLTDSFVLDNGARTVYVYHGPNADLDTRVLATRVALQYVDRIIREARSLSSNIEIVHVESRNEPPGFVAMFSQWDADVQIAVDRKQAKRFDPTTVSANEDDPTASGAAVKSFKDMTVSKISAWSTTSNASSNLTRTDERATDRPSSTHLVGSDSDRSASVKHQSLGSEPIVKPKISKSRKGPSRAGHARATSSAQPYSDHLEPIISIPANHPYRREPNTNDPVVQLAPRARSNGQTSPAPAEPQVFDELKVSRPLTPRAKSNRQTRPARAESQLFDEHKRSTSRLESKTLASVPKRGKSPTDGRPRPAAPSPSSSSSRIPTSITRPTSETQPITEASPSTHNRKSSAVPNKTAGDDLSTSVQRAGKPCSEPRGGHPPTEPFHSLPTPKTVRVNQPPGTISVNISKQPKAAAPRPSPTAAAARPSPADNIKATARPSPTGSGAAARLSPTDNINAAAARPSPTGSAAAAKPSPDSAKAHLQPQPQQASSLTSWTAEHDPVGSADASEGTHLPPTRERSKKRGSARAAGPVPGLQGKASSAQFTALKAMRKLSASSMPGTAGASLTGPGSADPNPNPNPSPTLNPYYAWNGDADGDGGMPIPMLDRAYQLPNHSNPNANPNPNPTPSLDTFSRSRSRSAQTSVPNPYPNPIPNPNAPSLKAARMARK